MVKSVVDLENKLKELYLNKDKVLISRKYIQELSSNEMLKLRMFHTKDVEVIRKDDEMFCGLRANTFVIERGFSEVFGIDVVVYVITANHKGCRAITMLVSDEVSDYIFD